uniref:Uncharacterized protein n=1 Tax=Triticum urartu TaxID=4572 RepID=A0A8R7QKG5_TRIUA
DVGTGPGAVAGRRVVEEGLVERGGEVLEVEHGDEGDEGERERVGGQERGAPPVPAAGRAVLRLHHPPSPRLVSPPARLSSVDLAACWLARLPPPASRDAMEIRRRGRAGRGDPIWRARRCLGRNLWGGWDLGVGEGKAPVFLALAWLC